MGVLAGLGVGIGLLLVWSGLTVHRGGDDPAVEGLLAPRPPRGPAAAARRLIVRSGADGLTVNGLLGVALACGLAGFVVAYLVTATLAVAAVAGVAAASVPVVVLRSRASRRLADRAACWPEAVDHLASGVRAGLSLPEALAAVGERGPEPLRQPFTAFARDYQHSGRFYECLDVLKLRLADPVGDRLVEALRVARDVGGGDLGRMLRTLSTFLRDEARTRGELVARQAWTVNGARLAVSAPWIVLVLMSWRRDAISQFGSGQGLFVLLLGLVVCVVAYRLMLRIGRLPREPRVLR